MSATNFLISQLTALGYPAPQTEYRFAPPRRFRFDACYPGIKLAIECEGGTWVQGRHTRPQGYERDCEKYNLAIIGGWRVLRFTTAMINDGRALATIEQALLGVSLR